MENNIINHSTGTIIMNGGNPLEGCPKDWDEARLIEAKLNEGKEENEPQWRFDCGFKLDYDGGIVTISSRFYPPKTHYGTTWDGTVTVRVMEKEVMEKAFNCKTLEDLKKEVDDYVNSVSESIQKLFITPAEADK